MYKHYFYGTPNHLFMPAYKINDQYGLYFITITVVGWLDVFTRPSHKHIIIESLKYCMRHKGLNVYSYVIMTNHLHLIINSEKKELSGIIRDFKQFTAKRLIKQILHNSKESRSEWMLRLFKYYAKYNKNNLRYQVWQSDSHAVELLSPRWINQKINYIHNNPVRDEIVGKPEDYLFSSASNYSRGEGVLDVKIIDVANNAKYL